MSKSLEKIIITHAAPTLAGHKCGSLLFWRGDVNGSFLEYLAALNAQLDRKGVRVSLLKSGADHALVYVYRPAMVQKRLNDGAVAVFLRRHGYTELTAEACLTRLSGRLCGPGGFPHEVGIFLDYPLRDVEGFMRDPASRDCYVGYWKVYADKEEALRRFCLYRKCRRVYLECWRRGFPVTRLTVAA